MPTHAWTLPPTLAGAAGNTLVGRRRKLAQLDAVWRSADDGGSAVLIGGAAGVGKTRLVAEFVTRCHAEGAAVLHGGCDSELGLPYQPWPDVIATALTSAPPDSIERLTDQRPWLLTLVPRLDPADTQLSVAGPEAMEIDRNQLFDAVRVMLSVLADSSPVIVVLEDLHWAGAPALSLFRFVARGELPPDTMLIGTFRDAPGDTDGTLLDTLAELRRLDRVTRVDLGGLEQSAVGELLSTTSVSDDESTLDELAARVTSRTGGNAFYVTELVRHIAAGTRGSVPNSVREVMRSRLQSLDPSVRHIAEIIAVAGRVEVPILQMAASTTPAEVITALESLVEAGLIIELPGPRTTYQFTHSLLQDAVNEVMTAVTRATTHLMLAEALEQRHGSDLRPVLADVARHFCAAATIGPADRAVEYCLRAAEQARRLAAYDEATLHLDTALGLVTEQTKLRGDVLVALAGVCAREGDHLRALQAAAEAIEIADEIDVDRIDADDLAARAALGYELAAHLGGVANNRAVRFLERALEGVEDGGDEVLALRLTAALGRAQALSGDDAALETVEATLTEARRVADSETLGIALEAATVIHTDPQRVLEVSVELEQLTARGGDPWRSGWATGNLMRALLTFGRLDELRPVLARHSEVANRNHFKIFQLIARSFACAVAIADARFEDAISESVAAEALGVTHGNITGGGSHGVQMFTIRRAQGRLEEMRPIVTGFAAPSTERKLWGPGLAITFAELRMLDEARRVFEHIAADGFDSMPRDASWPASLAYLADTCIAIGDKRRAAMLLDELEPYAGVNLMCGMTACLGPADTLRAGLADLIGDDEAVDRHYGAARDFAERAGSPLWLTDVLVRWSSTCRRRGEHQRAADLAAEADDIAERHGMSWDLGAGGGPGGGGEAAPARSLPYELTDRELEVLEQLAIGGTNRMIGHALHISQHTVANHVRTILRKTGCANRAEAAALAVRLGLI